MQMQLSIDDTPMHPTVAGRYCRLLDAPPAVIERYPRAHEDRATLVHGRVAQLCSNVRDLIKPAPVGSGKVFECGSVRTGADVADWDADLVALCLGDPRRPPPYAEFAIKYV